MAKVAVQTASKSAGTQVAMRSVTRSFGSLTALDDVSLTVGAGEVVGVVGPSGCGKSTLLELVAGLQEPDAGAVAVAAPADRRERCAYMPQRDLLLPWRDAVGNAALALECQGISRAAARDRARPLFERFGLAEFEAARPAELSGGMRQRVAFMRTLLPGRPVLLLDEPFGALDAITRASMHEWLADALEAEPRTVILVTHDVEEALMLCDRVAVLSPRPGPRGGRAGRAPPPRATLGVRPRVAGVARAGAGGAAVRRALLAGRPAGAVRGPLGVGGVVGLGRRPDAGLAGRDAGRVRRQPLAAAGQRLGHALRGAAGPGRVGRGRGGRGAGHAPQPHAARRRLPAAGGLAGRADRGAGPHLRPGVRLRHRSRSWPSWR